MQIPAQAFNDTVAVIGRIGSGKTYTAKGQLELLLDRGERVCIIDPTGVWYGLRSSANGKRPGYPVAVFGGEHADIAIVEASAEPLAKLVAERNLPVIVDVSEMGMAERVRFVQHFLDTLYRKNRTPLTLIVDEADLFAPQRALPGQELLLHRMEQIVRRGRTRGFRTWMITQRPAELHKSVLSQAGTLIAMRLTSPQDRAAIGDWIKGQADVEEGKRVLADLPKLPKGTGYLWCPAVDFLEKIDFPTIKTFDSSRTPEAGETIEPPSKLADVDLGGVLEALKPVEAPKTKASPSALAAEYTRGREEGFDAGVIKGRESADTVYREAFEQAHEILARALGAVPAPVVSQEDKNVAMRKMVERVAEMPTLRAPTAKPSGKATDRILNALGWWLGAGIETPSRHQIAFVAGYTVNGHFNNLVGALRTDGLVEYPGDGSVRLTAAGRGRVTVAPGACTRAELADRIRDVLRGDALRRIFDVVFKSRVPIAREVLAEQTGYTVNGHFNNMVGNLRTLGVVDYPAPGKVGLTSIFEGLY